MADLSNVHGLLVNAVQSDDVDRFLELVASRVPQSHRFELVTLVRGMGASSRMNDAIETTRVLHMTFDQRVKLMRAVIQTGRVADLEVFARRIPSGERAAVLRYVQNATGTRDMRARIHDLISESSDSNGSEDSVSS
jgi:hypothetical protein